MHGNPHSLYIPSWMLDVLHGKDNKTVDNKKSDVTRTIVQQRSPTLHPITVHQDVKKLDARCFLSVAQARQVNSALFFPSTVNDGRVNPHA